MSKFFFSFIRQAKCELAKMKNKETIYKTILEKRDELIVELDEKLEQLSEKSSETKVGWDVLFMQWVL